MLGLIIVLAVIVFIALALCVVTVPYATVEIHLKNKVLDIQIKGMVLKKKLHYDFANKPEPEKKTKADKKDHRSDGGFKNKLGNVKERIFNPETGFDIDELKNVKDELVETYKNIAEIIRKVLGKLSNRVHIPYLRIQLEYGTDNPAKTGMIYGSVWNGVGIIYPILSGYFDIAYPIIDITPDFYGKRFDADIKSIIKVRPAHIINAAFAGVFVPALTYLKNKIFKGRGKND